MIPFTKSGSFHVSLLLGLEMVILEFEELQLIPLGLEAQTPT